MESDHKPKGELVPGSFASVEVPLNEIEGGVMIPSQAVIPSLAGHGVFIDKGGVAELREVDLGVRTETQASRSSSDVQACVCLIVDRELFTSVEMITRFGSSSSSSTSGTSLAPYESVRRQFARRSS